MTPAEVDARVALLEARNELTHARQHIADLERENARLAASNAALTRLLCDHAEHVAELTPEPTKPPALTVLPGRDST